MKVHFYFIGEGRGLYGRRARHFERQGFRQSAVVRRAWRLTSADLIYVRNIPERTTDAQRLRMVAQLDRLPAATMLNHPRCMPLHDSKDRCFAAWQEAGLSVPDHVVAADGNELLELARSSPRLLCRVNTLACGNDTVVLDRPGRDELLAAWQRVSDRAALARQQGRAETRPMAVAFADSSDQAGLLHILRVFVVGDLVYGGYALVSREPIINHSSSVCATSEEVGSFLRISSRLDELLEDRSFCAMARRAVRLLGLDIGCLDLVLRGDEVVLLEANALWTPSYCFAGGAAGRRAFLADPQRWQHEAKSYCRWMDRIAFYRGMYDAFTQFQSPGWVSAAEQLTSP